jgi:transposase
LELTRLLGHSILCVAQGKECLDGSPIEVSGEFRREAVALYCSSDRSRAEVAKSLGISDGSLAAWVKAADAAEEPGALDADERAELHRLRKEVRDLRMDREILRKAAAYFAKETTR